MRHTNSSPTQYKSHQRGIADDNCFSDTRSCRVIAHTQVKLSVPEHCNVVGNCVVYFEHEVAASLTARADQQRSCPTVK